MQLFPLAQPYQFFKRWERGGRGVRAKPEIYMQISSLKYSFIKFTAILAVVLLINSCGKINYIQHQKMLKEGGTGSLSLKIAMASVVSGRGSKTILPETNMTPATYKVSGSGPAGSHFEESTSDGSIEISGLVFGEWVISAEALNEDGISIGAGQESATVISGQSTFCMISIMPSDGTGSLELTVEWAEKFKYLPL
jgi:hypothetical protein